MDRFVMIEFRAAHFLEIAIVDFGPGRRRRHNHDNWNAHESHYENEKSQA